MKTEITVIEPLPIGPTTAIEIARDCYKHWNGIVSFEEDLKDYLETGLVVVRPDVFAMGKVINLGGEPAMFIRMVVGNLRALLWLLPIHLRKICFTRRGDGRLKVYPLERLMRLSK